MTTERTVAIPEGVNVSLEGSVLKIKGPKGDLSRDMWYPGIEIRVEGNAAFFKTESKKKAITSMVGTLAAHCSNMCTGVSNGFQYSLKVVYSHFPIQLKVQGEVFEIVNFLGEKFPRRAKILKGTNVKVGNDEVIVTGIDKEVVGATASNIERATRIRDRDPRVFQDGIYIINRGVQ